MSQKISKKFMIVMSAFVAVVLLGSWLIASGKGKKILDVLMEEDEPTYEDDAPITTFTLLFGLRPGRYLLEREDGLDESDYIKIYEDETVRFVGEYWENKTAEDKALEEEIGYYMGPYFSERNWYAMHEFFPIVSLGKPYSGFGFGYEDADTLTVTRSRAGSDGVIDYSHEINEPDVPRYDEWSVTAHYIYAGEA